jgi:hypothetical protein
VYDGSQSLLVVILIHKSLVPSSLFVLAPQATGEVLMAYYLVLTVVLWVMVAALAAANKGNLSRGEPTGAISLVHDDKQVAVPS